MKYLLDTQVLIYLGCGYRDRIGRNALEAYSDPESKVFISQMSYFEMAIKINIGKLSIPIGLQNVMILAKDAGITMVPMDTTHILRYQSLALHESHRDPFDRYLISVAICEKMGLISDDGKFDLYDEIVRIWN